jgi:hypothetical protein
MDKKETEKKLKALTKEMQKTFLEYLDSLEEESNKIGKEEGYLSIAIFRDSISITSTTDETELKEENQISFWEGR